MKTIKTILAFLVLSFLLSCSKEDETTTPTKPISAAVSFENNTEVIIKDATMPFPPVGPASIPTSTSSDIIVTAEGSILDYKRIVLEMNISHADQHQLSFSLVAPNGGESLFVFRVGGSNNYSGSNKLRFNATFTEAMPNTNIIIPPGNYKESQGLGIFSTPVLLPIFSTLQDKDVSGTWKLKATDNVLGTTGAIKSWKIIFETGALKQ